MNIIFFWDYKKWNKTKLYEILFEKDLKLLFKVIFLTICFNIMKISNKI